MADDRPLFDDEDLPDWLKNAGITFAGKSAVFQDQAESPASPPKASSGGTGTLPWVNETSAPPAPFAPAQPDIPAWMNAPAPAQAARPSAGDLPPWMQGNAAAPPPGTTGSAGTEFDDLPMPEFEDLDWMKANANPPESSAPSHSAAPVGGTTSMLPWRQGISESPAEPPQRADPFADEAAESIPEPTPELTPQPPQGPRGLKNLLNQAPPPAESVQPPASNADLTFEEWEQRETAKERPKPSESTPINAENEWLSAVSEIPSEAAESATDWFNEADLAAPPQSSDLDESAPPAENIPDWLTLPAAQTSAPELDLDSLFGSTPEPVTESTPDTGDGTELDWQDESAPFDAAPADIPDWITGMKPTAATENEVSPGSDSDDSWLQDLAAASPIDEAAVPAESGALPDWLANMAPAVPDEPVPVPDLSDVPEWMRDMAPVEPTPIAEPAQDFDWLDSNSINASSAAASETEVSAEPGALPDWLAAVQPGVISSPAAPTAGTSQLPSKSGDVAGAERPLNSSDIDALLNISASSTLMIPPDKSRLEEPPASLENDLDLDTLLGPAPELPPAEPPALPEPSAPPAVQTPSLKRQTGPLRRLPISQPKKPTEPAPGEIAEANLPDFVADLRPTDAPVPLTVGPVKVGVREAPLAQLSDQMRQLRERAREIAPPTTNQVPTTGPLAEIQNTLTVEPIIVQAASGPAVTTAAQAIVSDLQARRVKLIQNLLEIEDEQTGAQTAKAKAPARARPKLDRLLITLLLLIALTAPFLTDAVNLMGAPGTSSPTAAQAVVFSALDAIPAGQPVLMAFEYGPTGSGELDDLSRALLRDLIKKGAKPVIVSTNPSGAMHAEALMTVFGRNADELSALNRADKPLVARTDYVVLRYLPAGAAGVRSVLNAVYGDQKSFEAQSQFLTDVEGKPSGLNALDIQVLGNVPVIVLAETADDVRNWAEQYRAPANLNGRQPPKIILAVAASADATARTYSASVPGTIIGPLIGLRDATVYRTLRQPPAKETDVKAFDQRWQSTGLGALVAGLIIFLGMIFNLIRALRRPRSQGARR